MHSIHPILRAVPLFALGLMAAPVSAAVISCGSVNGAYQYCSADTGRGVQLVRQLSRSACLQAQSWGYDRGGVWVQDGCAASFSVGDGGGSSRGAEGRGGPAGAEGRGGPAGHTAGAAIVGGIVGALLGAAVSGGGEQAAYTRRTASSRSSQQNWWQADQDAHASRMQSIRAGMDPDTDVMAAQREQNARPPESPSDAVRRDMNRIDNAIDEDRARIESAGVMHPDNSSDSSSDPASEYQANQDFQRQVAQRRADENAAAEETPQ